MAYFAEIDSSNTVQRVISVANDVIGEPELQFPDTEPLGQAFIGETVGLPGVWKQTSFNGTFRGRFAGRTFQYDEATDEFVPPGWTLIDGVWSPPVEEPTE